jgi:Lon protease-like protein
MDNNIICPIFPLDLVQFPGALTPLHIFEMRYRRMLEDVLAGDKTFGLIYREAGAPAGGQLGAGEPASGEIVGCLVQVAMARQLPDGRSNILCVGTERFTIVRMIEDDGETPYARAEVEVLTDDLEFDDLSPLVAETQALFAQMQAARQSVRHPVAGGTAPPDQDEDLPDLPDQPGMLSFIIASYLDVDLARKQRWLEMTETGHRLRQLNQVLADLTAGYQQQARVDRLSRTNGHGGHGVKLPGH